VKGIGTAGFGSAEVIPEEFAAFGFEDQGAVLRDGVGSKRIVYIHIFIISLYKRGADRRRSEGNSACFLLLFNFLI
jgi:hypothetical protein